MHMGKLNVLLLFGGESSEHKVSISSARNVYDAIDKQKYNVNLCYIDVNGKWWSVAEFADQISTDNCNQLLPIFGTGRFVTESDGQVVEPDVMFPILHGRNGEDGTVQGVAQLLHIPMVGCDVTASGIAMNKLACKAVLRANGVDVIPYTSHYEYQEVPNFDQLTQELDDTLFVKPARAGSSVGVSKVRSQEELKQALNEAHQHDPIALIEMAIVGQELEVAVLGTPPSHRVSSVGEVIPGEDFYTYEDKYSADSMAKININADISAKAKEQIRDTAKHIYQILDCKGLSRIDYILRDDGMLYVLEVNTLPGFTNISMYPKLWQEQGISYSQLIDELITDAVQNGTMNK